MTETTDRATEPERYNILGAGVIGLTTALELVREGHEVTLHSREGKPVLSSDSTSSNAVGQFLPWVPAEHAEALLGDVDLETVAEYSRIYYGELAKHADQTGVMAVGNIELLLEGAEWPAGLPVAMRAEERELSNPIPFTEPDGESSNCKIMLEFETFSINTKKTIAYLADQAEKAGVKFVSTHIDVDKLEELDGVIINAMGIGAPDLDKATESNNFKGHTFIIEPEDGYMPNQALSVEDLIIMPREDGTVICGALYIEDSAHPIPEEEEAEELFERLGKLLDAVAKEGIVGGLRLGLLEHSEVRLHSGGYRVELSDGGIRIAPDEENERLLHAYGFGGLGWSVGPHFAKRIAKQAKELHKRIKEK